ncbi:hypothetical protein EYF80_005341 [Liparis tanakae]|uniref:Uncharacterized protein n=1 Tax=Liparis tanakae TaxID=230148 RepID=A0A4Z2J3U6_9TELE|nr:hypothetical protein EYF80_005341 [Liparis tanakae]
MEKRIRCWRQEFRRCHVHADHNLDVWSKAAFITHVGGVLTVFLLDDIFEIVVDLGSNAHGFFECARANGQDHELLHGELVACIVKVNLYGGVSTRIKDLSGVDFDNGHGAGT